MTTMSALPWRDEDVRGFGMAVGGPGRVLRPTTTEQIADAFADVQARGGSIALRGAGCSYGDAATSRAGHVLDLTCMNRVLAFDPATGIATVEPGVTVRDLWRHSIAYGFWPKVVSGTMAVTMGGAAAQSLFGGGANIVMTKITAVFAALFMVTSLSLAFLSAQRGGSVMDKLPAAAESALPLTLPGTDLPPATEPARSPVTPPAAQ